MRDAIVRALRAKQAEAANTLAVPAKVAVAPVAPTRKWSDRDDLAVAPRTTPKAAPGGSMHHRIVPQRPPAKVVIPQSMHYRIASRTGK